MPRTALTLASSLFALAACDPAVAPMDAATEPDAGPPDAGPPLACSETTSLDAVLGETVSVMLDTSTTQTRPRDLGLACGNVDSELRWAPQEVVELRLPGSGRLAVQLSTASPDGTDGFFNTVVQVRESCDRAPTAAFPPACFDDISERDFRSRGWFSAMGGDTVYVFVTGFSEPPAEQGTVDRGRVQLDVTARANEVPTLTEGSLLLALDDARIRATGRDPDADVVGVALNFYGPDGLLDIYGDGEATEDADVFIVPFGPAPTTADYTGTATVPGAQVNLAGYLRAVGAVRARLRVYDAAFALSDPLEVPIQEAELVGLGEACGADRVCRPEMSCGGDGLCAASAAAAAACAGAMAIAIEPPSTTATELTVSGRTGAGQGTFMPSATCTPAQGSIGAEALYTVEVPADVTADLILTTELPGTGDTDTIVYVRSACADSGAELGCNDDRAPMDLQSDVEVRDLASGVYTIFVERYGGSSSGSLPHALSVTLRPVLAAGATCDDAGAANRCAGAACSGGVCP